jgi:hypothetical protein
MLIENEVSKHLIYGMGKIILVVIGKIIMIGGLMISMTYQIRIL